MTESARYVAIVEQNDKIEQTFIVDGGMSLTELFEHINDRRILRKATGIRLHRDESSEPTYIDRINEMSRGSYAT
jgi:hypothetical protein